MSVKVTSDMIRPFSGEGDVVAWLKKVRLVAKLQKITELESFLPLYLEGEALALYLEMDESDQLDVDEIEKRLKAAFSDDMFTAYAKLVKYRWSGENVDVYANEIRRLAGLAGFEKDGLENIVRLTFINGFPDSISASMQQLPNIKFMPICELIERARVFTSKLSTAATAHVYRDSQQSKNSNRSDIRPNIPMESNDRRGYFRGQCYRCGGPHMAKHCKDVKGIICYRCRQPGHISTQCQQGNDNRGSVAPAVTPCPN